jgi:hypothetical protein
MAIVKLLIKVDVLYLDTDTWLATNYRVGIQRIYWSKQRDLYKPLFADTCMTEYVEKIPLLPLFEEYQVKIKTNITDYIKLYLYVRYSFRNPRCARQIPNS